MERKTVMNSKHLLLAVFILAMFSLIAVAAQQGGTPAARPTTKHVAKISSGQPQDEGERLFEQHCSRCHAAPEGFSPRISGTILRHMRVRASLSQREEETLLHFFNP
jgi:cytochrome c5